MDVIEDLLTNVARLDPDVIRERLDALEDQQKTLRTILRMLNRSSRRASTEEVPAS